MLTMTTASWFFRFCCAVVVVAVGFCYRRISLLFLTLRVAVMVGASGVAGAGAPAVMLWQLCVCS